jgi:hypothetical protein
MSWQSELTTIVRHLIDDTDISNPTYTDCRLETAILVSARLLLLEADFEQTYTVNVDQCLLSPDPTTSGAEDEGFINLLCLKTACIILGNEAKAKSRQAVKITDGPSSVDSTKVAENLLKMHEKMCEAYEDYKFNFTAVNNNVGKAILTPYSPGSYGVRR